MSALIAPILTGDKRRLLDLLIKLGFLRLFVAPGALVLDPGRLNSVRPAPPARRGSGRMRVRAKRAALPDRTAKSAPARGRARDGARRRVRPPPPRALRAGSRARPRPAPDPAARRKARNPHCHCVAQARSARGWHWRNGFDHLLRHPAHHGRGAEAKLQPAAAHAVVAAAEPARDIAVLLGTGKGERDRALGPAPPGPGDASGIGPHHPSSGRLIGAFRFV